MTIRKIFFSLVVLSAVMFTGKKVYDLVKKAIPCFRCNIIVIVVDSLRASELPCYGYTLATAPALCKYAAQNTLFTRAYANATWTRPSNMSIITSLYPTSHGMVDPISVSLNTTVTTLPQVLKKFGYSTRFVANDQIHMGVELGYERIFSHRQLTSPTFNGGDTMEKWYNAIDAMKEDNKHFMPSFTYFHTDHVHEYVNNILDIPPQFPLDPQYTAPTLPQLTRFTDRTWIFTKKYLKDMRQISSVESMTARFDAWIAQFDKARTREEALAVFTGLPNDMKTDIFRNIAQDDLNEHYFTTIVPLYRHLYDDAIRTFDLSFAKIIRKIKENGLEQNTIVLVTSDHGQMLGEHNLLGHILSMDKEEITIPLILRVPGLKEQRSGQLTQHIDIFPTLLELVGIPVPKGLAGISLKNSLMGEKNSPKNEYVISHTTLPHEMYAIITDNWKLMEAPYPSGVYRELYDLVRDPEETKSVAQSNQKSVEALTTLLHTTLKKFPVYLPVESAFPYWRTEDDRTNEVTRKTTDK